MSGGLEALEGFGEGNGNLLLVQHGSVVIASKDFHTIFEGLDVKLLKESSLRVGDLDSNLTHLEFLDDFNLSLLNLGRNLECVEE